MLAIAIERDDPRPIYRQIEDQIRSSIRDGRLAPDTRLPSVRDLSDQLAVARITVANAYDDLVSEGYLTARVGSGTKVARDLPDAAPFAATVPLRLLGQPTTGSAPSPGRIDLRPQGLGLDLFPTETWGLLLQRAWREIGHPGIVNLDWIHGDPLLREALARYVGVTRGVAANAEDIMVFPNVTAICGAVSRAFLGTGGVGIVEDPGCPFFHRAMASGGARIIGVPSHYGGILPEDLPSRADLLLVGPSWTYPLGGVMTMRRRRQISAWSRKSGAIIVEHDWAGMVRFEGGPLPAIESLDQGGQTIFAGGFWETIPPARVAFAVVPPDLRARLEAFVALTDGGPSFVEQRALATFISEGHLEAHLRRLRVALSARRKHLATVARRLLPDVELSIGSAGMQAILYLNDHAAAKEVVKRAAGQLVDVDPLLSFALGGESRPGLVIDYSAATEKELSQAMHVIRGAILRSGGLERSEAPA